MELKKLRLEKGLTQEQAAQLLGVTRRTYNSYERNEDKIPAHKLEYLLHTLRKYGYIDETHGVLTVDAIKQICQSIFAECNVEFAYLFGSYAKGLATETSDVDILVSMPINGLMFYELVETLRENLKKKVDLLDVAQLNNNPQLVQEILKDGVKIYG